MVESNPYRGKQIQVEITPRFGKEGERITISGIETPYPGLALTKPANSRTWNVTHVPSGLAVVHTDETVQSRVLEILEKAGTGKIDWTQSSDKLEADPAVQKYGKRISRIAKGLSAEDTEDETLSQAAENWWKGKGKRVPKKGSSAYNKMYEEWVNWAFDPKTLKNPLTKKEVSQKLKTAQYHLSVARGLLKTDPHAAEEQAYIIIGLLTNFESETRNVAGLFESFTDVMYFHTEAHKIITEADRLQGRTTENPPRRSISSDTKRRLINEAYDLIIASDIQFQKKGAPTWWSQNRDNVWKHLLTRSEEQLRATIGRVKAIEAVTEKEIDTFFEMPAPPPSAILNPACEIARAENPASTSVLPHHRKKSKLDEARAITMDCYNYFIKGHSKKDDGGLSDLFYQRWQREHGKDYYPEISEMCLDREMELAHPEEWTSDFLLHLAYEFQGRVPSSPNYPVENNFRDYYEKKTAKNPAKSGLKGSRFRIGEIVTVEDPFLRPEWKGKQFSIVKLKYFPRKYGEGEAFLLSPAGTNVRYAIKSLRKLSESNPSSPETVPIPFYSEEVGYLTSNNRLAEVQDWIRQNKAGLNKIAVSPAHLNVIKNALMLDLESANYALKKWLPHFSDPAALRRDALWEKIFEAVKKSTVSGQSEIGSQNVCAIVSSRLTKSLRSLEKELGGKIWSDRSIQTALWSDRMHDSFDEANYLFEIAVKKLGLATEREFTRNPIPELWKIKQQDWQDYRHLFRRLSESDDPKTVSYAKKQLEKFAREHSEQIALALSEGKTVPEEVLKDYPELASAKRASRRTVNNPTKESWQMTNIEYAKSHFPASIAARITQFQKSFAPQHQVDIRAALAAGKPVPAIVLKDYPDIASFGRPRITNPENTYVLLRDGKFIFEGSESECYVKLQNIQSQSASHAMKYEGYSIIPKSQYISPAPHPEYIEFLEAEHKNLWEKSCEWEKIPADSKFVVFSPENPYNTARDEAMGKLMKARAAHKESIFRKLEEARRKRRGTSTNPLKESQIGPSVLKQQFSKEDRVAFQNTINRYKTAIDNMEKFRDFAISEFKRMTSRGTAYLHSSYQPPVFGEVGMHEKTYQAIRRFLRTKKEEHFKQAIAALRLEEKIRRNNIYNKIALKTAFEKHPEEFSTEEKAHKAIRVIDEKYSTMYPPEYASNAQDYYVPIRPGMGSPLDIGQIVTAFARGIPFKARVVGETKDGKLILNAKEFEPTASGRIIKEKSEVKPFRPSWMKGNPASQPIATAFRSPAGFTRINIFGHTYELIGVSFDGSHKFRDMTTGAITDFAPPEGRKVEAGLIGESYVPSKAALKRPGELVFDIATGNLYHRGGK